MSVASLFTPADREEIAQAVREAESKTSAEIVPVVAAASGRYDRPEDIVGLWVGSIALALVWWFWPQPTPQPGDWGETPRWYQLVALLGAGLIGFVLGALVASRIGWLRRLFTPHGQMIEEVQARTRGLFFDSRVHHTAGATGLLVYVSLFEHLAVVLGDRAIEEKLGQPTLDQICARLTSALHQGTIAQALATAIREAGDRLGPVLPRLEGDVNELPDALVVLEE